MYELQPPDCHYVNAAQGWLALGNRTEAAEELTHIHADNLLHPDVLEIEYQIKATGSDWIGALEVSRKLLIKAADRAGSWLNCSYALRRVPEGGLEAAWNFLRPALDMFPKEPTIAYNLACYACQLHRPHQARKLLETAFKTGDKKALKRMALQDPDLACLQPELAAM